MLRPVRSRRMLHSTFWTHGSAELNLPPWWTPILGEDGEGSHPAGSETERGRRSGPTSAFDGLLLDFLYPSNTLALIGQFASYGLDKWESRRSRYGLFGHGKRTYMSSACDSGAEPEAQVSEPRLQPNDHDLHTATRDVDTGRWSPSKRASPLESLRDMISHPIQSSQNDKLWQLHTQCVELAGIDHLVLPLLERLSYSHRRIDAERAVRLFRGVPFHERTAIHYRLVVRAHLSLRDAEQALHCVKESWERRMTNSGEHRLLAYAIDKGLWDLGLETWKLYFDGTDYGRKNCRLWRLVRVLPNLWDQALALAKYTKTQFDSIGNVSDPATLSLLRFTRSMILGSLLTRHITVEVGKVIALFQALRPLKLRKGSIYDRAIANLIKTGNTRAAVRLYKHLRDTEYTTPSRRTLHIIFKVYCSFRSIRGMQMLLDDWFRYYTAPTSAAYELTMAAFAAQGNAPMVDKLFSLFLSRFGKPTTLAPLISLLCVHARRGDAEETVNQFKRISDEFNLKPDTTCWNILLNALAKQDDVEGVQQCFDKMRRSGINPDEYTTGTLIGFCANRGDIEGAEDMYQLSESLGLEKSTAVIGSLVLAYINDGQLDRAENLTEKASAMDLKGSPTRMWNYILTAFASRRDGDGVSRTLQRMQQLRVPMDGMTYGALMQFLVNIKQTEAAYRILRNTMPRGRIRATAFHYSIIMEGFAIQGELDKALKAFDRMMKRGIRPTISTQIVLLKATASADLKEFKARVVEGQSLQLASAEKILDEALLDSDASEMAVEEPIKGIKGQLLPAVYPAALFDFIIFLYGREGYSEKALDLYDRYLSATKTETSSRPVHTIKLIAALMVTHLQGKRYEEVAKYWNLAVKTAQLQTTPWSPSDSSAPKRLPSSRKYLLTTPFRPYAKSLCEQGNIDKLIQEVETLNRDGFELENCSLNLYIQLLALNKRTLLAFELCETRLMCDWPGWRLQLRRKGMTNRQIKKLPKSPMRPSYATLVYLAGVFVETSRLMRMGSGEAKDLMAELMSKCPKTMNAVQNLPRSDNDLQRFILEW
ncbi:hypothetical protein GP486_006673 [Trichoglossum hirsutum]|uniref:Pentacotripeptide-repeat region of PRORP domain-containing protein n=1 Tax=Trichoglossum hirsutum TaxID=265104 RepID=A0A9P8IE30_9PEZI|nr:hypothetical protein GP486_006673 [Trichoglossum hirsutum]